MKRKYRIEHLSEEHDRTAFLCGDPSLDLYLRRYARRDVERNRAAVFILTHDHATVAGFYTLSAHAVKANDLPPAVAKELPRFVLPVTLLGRMAVSQPLQGKGLGSLVLLHALESAWESSQQLNSLAVVVDAKTGDTAFYRKHGFLSLPEQPGRMFMPMEQIEKIFKD